ncbi:hypothetical protein E2562_000196, partial [Oryza meyeriana var. granulata]
SCLFPHPCCLLSYLPSRATLATARFLARAAASSLLPTVRLLPFPSSSPPTNRQVMTAAVERGWSTFLFGSKDLGKDWSSTARINPLFIDGLEIFDEQNQKVVVISEVSSPRELELIQLDNVEVENIVIDFRGGWQVIPAENIVAAFQGCRGIVLAVSTNSTEVQVFLEALEQGLDEVIVKVEDMDDIIKLKDYFDTRNEAKSQLLLTKATVSKVEVVGMGDRVCVDL